jgi:glycosyltransferase involved in cell wall biosynthesis
MKESIMNSLDKREIVSSTTHWLTLQLGSREHYSVPAELYKAGLLERCLTDLWVRKGLAPHLANCFPKLAARRNDAIDDKFVTSNTVGGLFLDAYIRASGLYGWDAVMLRNEWFSQWCARQLLHIDSTHLFSYSYTAFHSFIEAKRRGTARCILGQIDPGPREVEIVHEATSNYRHLDILADNPPKEYWAQWREEIALADNVVVNSPWSAKLLQESGVSVAKLLEIPLVYQTSPGKWHEPIRKSIRRDQRLKALFLGSVILRKGVGQLFDAILILKNEQVDFVIAGPIGLKVPHEIMKLPNVRILGPVDKLTAKKLYSDSDVFLFSTLSDGFGLTQLEALGHGLPVIASKYCGQVVQHQVSGLILPEVSPLCLAEYIMFLVRDRDLLERLKLNARIPDMCQTSSLVPALLSL